MVANPLNDKRMEQMSIEKTSTRRVVDPRVHITNMHSTLVWTYLKPIEQNGYKNDIN